MTGYVLAFSMLLLQPPAEATIFDEAGSLGRHFSGLDGCFVLQNLVSGERIAVNEALCDEPLPPCSTFKIPHALLALELGIVDDENTMLAWDGAPQPVTSWERDHTLASAMRNSVLWYFQHCARQIGLERMRSFVNRIEYGNEAVGEPIDRFWLAEGSLRVSASEQVEFLARLYSDDLPVSEGAISLVRSLIVQTGDYDIGGGFSGKTGSHWVDGRWVLGWFVGSIEHDAQRWVFATNLRGPDGASGMRAREITVAILHDLDLIESNAGSSVDAPGE